MEPVSNHRHHVLGRSAPSVLNLPTQWSAREKEIPFDICLAYVQDLDVKFLAALSAKLPVKFFADEAPRPH
jgi:hypothetical protein